MSIEELCTEINKLVHTSGQSEENLMETKKTPRTGQELRRSEMH